MFRTRIAICLLLITGSLIPGNAQTVTARLEGIVQDASGAVISGAKISAVEIKTQQRNDFTSTAQGSFIFPSLQPGNYTLTVEAAGFRTEIVSSLELNAAAVVNQLIKLQVGMSTETISVTARDEAVQTTDSQRGTSITLRDIETLPQLARTPISLATFQPGVAFNPADGASFAHVNGQRQGSNNTTLDGIDANDSTAPRLGLSLTANNTDSIGEFRMITEGGKAEYGRSAGGQIQLITRSGTNEVHGGVFDYLRNTDLNANDFFNNSSGIARPKFIQNIYGFSLGGPVVFPKIYNGKNKTFIFGNFQGRRTRQEVVRNRTVLTTDAKKGLFDYKDANGVVQQYNIVVNDPRKIGIDPAVAKTLALLPDPNNNDLGDGLETAGYRFNNPVPSLEDQFTIKGDQNISSNHHLFLRWSWQRNNAIDNLNSQDATFPGRVQGSQGGHRWGFSAGYDWNVTPVTVNEFRAGHQSATTNFFRDARLKGPTLISNDYTDPISAAFFQGRNSPVNDFSDALTHVAGKHTIKAGVNLRYTTQFGTNEAGIYPNVTFARANGNLPLASIGPQGLSSTNRTNFENLYNELLGRVDQITQTFYSDLKTFQAAGTPRVRNFSLKEYGFYLQDDFKISRRLTLNYGLRWDIFQTPSETNGLQGTLTTASSIANLVPTSSATIAPAKQFYDTDFNNFAPRFGFAYDVFGDGKTAIRGNYGIFFDRTLGASISTADGATPGFAQSVPVFPNNVSGSDVRISDPGVLYPAQPGAPVLTLANNRGTSITLYNPNLRNGYVQQFSLNIQREVLRSTVLDVGYVGSRGVKLFLNRDLNQPDIYNSGFLAAFNEVRNNLTTPANVSPNNTLVRIFGSAAAAISSIGASTFTNGSVAAAANTVDRSNYTKYAAAGLSDFYLRKYPQFNQLTLGTNDGRNYYDALQVSVRRNTGALKVTGNYTFSKALDNSSAEGNGTSTLLDSYNLGLNKAVSDFNHTHVFSSTAVYTLPIGKGKKFGSNLPRWADSAVGGWDLGALTIWQSGSPFSISSQRTTGPSPINNTYAQYSGTDYHIGTIDRRGNGVFYFTPDQVSQFGFPVAGSIGNAGRNVFNGPRYFNLDFSLVKSFKVTERSGFNVRIEAYNLFNNTNFALPGTNLNTIASFGKISATAPSSSRIMQVSLRYDF